MANNPKKAQDATEAAMAAIQEALNVRDAEMKAAKPASEPRKSSPENRKAASNAPSAPVVESQTSTEPVQAKPEPDFIPELSADVEPGRPANDDWRSVGQILQNASAPSSRTLYIGAAIASGSFRTHGMIVAPCSIKTMSNIACGNTGDLISRRSIGGGGSP